MINQKTLTSLTPERQYDIIQCKVAVARKALELAKDEDPKVIQVLREYVIEAEELLEKAAWSLR